MQEGEEEEEEEDEEEEKVNTTIFLLHCVHDPGYGLRVVLARWSFSERGIA